MYSPDVQGANMAGRRWMSRVKPWQVYRRLGIRQLHPGKEIEKAVESCLHSMYGYVSVHSYYEVFPVSRALGSTVIIGPMTIKSRSLDGHLWLCNHAAVFGATLGLQVDREIYRNGIGSISESTLVDACASVLIEAVCDEICHVNLREEAQKLGCRMRRRFSPGYGDFTVEPYGRMIIDALDLTKRSGIYMTEGGMMVPTKTVTAVVGFLPEDA